MDRHEIVATLEGVWTSLLELGRGLAEEDWDRPTDCPGWTVKDHYSHVVSTERMLEGLPLEDAHPLPDAPHVRNEIGRFNEREVDARRSRSGADVLAELADVVAQRRTTLDTAGDDYFAAPATTPTGPATVLEFLSIRILDCWVHEQDVRRAVGRPGHLGGAAAEHTTDRLLRTLPIVIGKRAATPEGATVVLRLTGPVERTVPVTVRDGRAAIVAEPPADPLATVTMDSETFLVLATGRGTAADRAGHITRAGDQPLGQKVVDQLNMMI